MPDAGFERVGGLEPALGEDVVKAARRAALVDPTRQAGADDDVEGHVGREGWHSAEAGRIGREQLLAVGPEPQWYAARCKVAFERRVRQRRQRRFDEIH
jgi:hypothetical protein